MPIGNSKLHAVVQILELTTKLLPDVEPRVEINFPDQHITRITSSVEKVWLLAGDTEETDIVNISITF